MAHRCNIESATAHTFAGRTLPPDRFALAVATIATVSRQERPKSEHLDMDSEAITGKLTASELAA